MRKGRIELIVLSVLFWIISCQPRGGFVSENIEMRDRLFREIARPSDTLDLSALFVDRFDSVYVFPPYYPMIDIEEQTGFELDRLELSSESKDIASVDESSNLFLFKRNGSLTDYFLFPRVNGDFSGNPKHVFLPSELVFVKVTKADSTWLYLRHVEE